MGTLLLKYKWLLLFGLHDLPPNHSIFFSFFLEIHFYPQVRTNTSNISHNNEQTGSSLCVRLCQGGKKIKKELEQSRLSVIYNPCFSAHSGPMGDMETTLRISSPRIIMWCKKERERETRRCRSSVEAHEHQHVWRGKDYLSVCVCVCVSARAYVHIREGNRTYSCLLATKEPSMTTAA